MIKHGFSYKDLAEMSYQELKFWLFKLTEFYKNLMEDI